MSDISAWFDEDDNTSQISTEQVIDEIIEDDNDEEEVVYDENSDEQLQDDDVTEEDVEEEQEEAEPEEESDEEGSTVEEPATETQEILTREILDHEGNFVEVEITEEDLLQLAADKTDGFRDMLMDTVNRASPLVKTYSEVPLAKWLIDNLNAGYKVEDLVKMIAEDSVKRGVIDVAKILEAQQEEEYLTPEEKRIRDLEREISDTKKQLNKRAEQEPSVQKQQQVAVQMQNNIAANERHLTAAFNELGIDPNSLNDTDMGLIQQAFLTLYPKDSRNPKAGFVGVEEREYKYNQIKGIVNLALKINKPQAAQAKQKAVVKQQVKQSKAPKIAPANVSASASRQLPKQTKSKATYYTEAQRLNNVSKLFSF